MHTCIFLHQKKDSLARWMTRGRAFKVPDSHGEKLCSLFLCWTSQIVRLWWGCPSATFMRVFFRRKVRHFSFSLEDRDNEPQRKGWGNNSHTKRFGLWLKNCAFGGNAACSRIKMTSLSTQIHEQLGVGDTGKTFARSV